MDSFCCMNFKSFFFFCDYKETNLFKRAFKLIYRNLIQIFIKSKSTHAAEVIAFMFKYFIISAIVIIISIVFYNYGEYIKSKLYQLESWLTIKYQESNL